ncbi:hypothetical protein ABPG72_012606 [Tetrahymena utriculariae]
MKPLDWIPQKQLSQEQQSRIQLIQGKLDQIKQDVPEFEIARNNLQIKKDEFIKQAENIFQTMKQEAIKSISRQFDDFENELANYQIYQHYISSSYQQMQQYLSTQTFYFTISNQVERICYMNLNTLNLIGQKFKQSYEQDKSNLDNLIIKLLADIEAILKQKIQSREFTSPSSIQSILKDLNQLQLRINPLDQNEENLRISSQQQENLLKYFEIHSQQSQGNLAKDNSSQNLIQQALEQLEKIEAQEELNKNTQNNNQILQDKIDVCLPTNLQDFQKEYQVIQTSHAFKEYPQRFNPQQISIPNIAIDSYYSTKLTVGGWDGQVELFDARGDVSQKIVKQLFDGPVKVIAFIQSKQLVCVSACEQSREHSRILLLDQNTLSIIHTIELQKGEKVVEILELNKNENILVSQLIIVTETSIYLYSLTDYKQLKSFATKQNILRAIILQNNNIFLSDQSGNICHYTLNQDLQLTNTIQAHSDWIHLLSIVESHDNTINLLSGSYDKKIALREYNTVTRELKLIAEVQNELPQSLLQVDSKRFIVSCTNTLNFYEGNNLKRSLFIGELDEIQQLCLIQNHIAISGKSDNPNIIII